MPWNTLASHCQRNTRSWNSRNTQQSLIVWFEKIVAQIFNARINVIIKARFVVSTHELSFYYVAKRRLTQFIHFISYKPRCGLRSSTLISESDVVRWLRIYIGFRPYPDGISTLSLLALGAVRRTAAIGHCCHVQLSICLENTSRVCLFVCHSFF